MTAARFGRLDAKRRDALGDHALREPAPAGMQDGDCRAGRVGAHDGDRQAVGGHGEQRDARLVGPEAVARRAAGGRACAVHRRRVHLAVEREVLVRRDRATRTRAGGSPRRLSGSSPVPRVRLSESYGAVADAADARRERDDVAGLVPADHASTRHPGIGARTAISIAAPRSSMSSPRRCPRSEW